MAERTGIIHVPAEDVPYSRDLKVAGDEPATTPNQIADSAYEFERIAQSSIELHRDAKGTYSYTAKIYFCQEVEGAREVALEQLALTERTLHMRYVLPQ